MHAIAYRQPGALEQAESLSDVSLPDPQPGPGDILVRVEAVSVNPVDVKVRASAKPPADTWKVLGWDAAGTVVATGGATKRFQVGDRVYYAGDITRPGTDAELHVVDERIVGHLPASLSFAEAAAMPLTTITAWEALFDRLDVRRPVAGAAPAVLIIGGASGVASIAIQLARKLTDLTVIATASRPETRAWVEQMGAHHVVDHSRPLAPQIEVLQIGAPGLVFSTTQSARHLADVAELIAPQGRYALIDDPDHLDIGLFKRKSVSVHWEFMFTRSLFGTADMDEQGRLLDEVGRLLDAGTLRTTLKTLLSPLDAATLKRAHAMTESGANVGKIVVQRG